MACPIMMLNDVYEIKFQFIDRHHIGLHLIDFLLAKKIKIKNIKNKR